MGFLFCFCGVAGKLTTLSLLFSQWGSDPPQSRTQ